MRDNKGRFVKGNQARTVAKKKQMTTKKVLGEMEMLQAKIYNESLKQILEKLEAGEMGANELIRVNASVAEMVTTKADKKPKKASKSIVEGIDELKDLIKE